MYDLDGDYGVVDSIVIVDETQTMYDLTVDAVHTFAVGDGEWVVHNQDFDLGKYCNITVTTDYKDEYIVEAVSNRTGRKLVEFTFYRDRGRLATWLLTTEGGKNITGYNLQGWQVWHGLWNYNQGGINIPREVGNTKILVGHWTNEGMETNLNRFRENIRLGMSPEEAAFNTNTGRYAYDVDFNAIGANGVVIRHTDVNGEATRMNVDFVRPNHPNAIYVQLAQPD